MRGRTLNDRQYVELLTTLRRQARAPLWIPPPNRPDLRLDIIDGNTLDGATNTYGIKKISTVMTSVASAWDPTIGNTETATANTPGNLAAEDGVGRAVLYVNNVQQSKLVLVLLDGHAPSQIPSLIGGQTESVKTLGAISLKVGAGPQTVSLYVPCWM